MLANFQYLACCCCFVVCMTVYVAGVCSILLPAHCAWPPMLWYMYITPRRCVLMYISAGERVLMNQQNPNWENHWASVSEPHTLVYMFNWEFVCAYVRTVHIVHTVCIRDPMQHSVHIQHIYGPIQFSKQFSHGRTVLLCPHASLMHSCSKKGRLSLGYSWREISGFSAAESRFASHWQSTRVES